MTNNFELLSHFIENCKLLMCKLIPNGRDQEENIDEIKFTGSVFIVILIRRQKSFHHFKCLSRSVRTYIPRQWTVKKGKYPCYCHSIIIKHTEKENFKQETEVNINFWIFWTFLDFWDTNSRYGGEVVAPKRSHRVIHHYLPLLKHVSRIFYCVTQKI